MASINLFRNVPNKNVIKDYHFYLLEQYSSIKELKKNYYEKNNDYLIDLDLAKEKLLDYKNLIIEKILNINEAGLKILFLDEHVSYYTENHIVYSAYFSIEIEKLIYESEKFLIDIYKKYQNYSDDKNLLNELKYILWEDVNTNSWRPYLILYENNYYFRAEIFITPNVLTNTNLPAKIFGAFIIDNKYLVHTCNNLDNADCFKTLFNEMCSSCIYKIYYEYVEHDESRNIDNIFYYFILISKFYYYTDVLLNNYLNNESINIECDSDLYHHIEDVKLLELIEKNKNIN